MFRGVHNPDPPVLLSSASEVRGSGHQKTTVLERLGEQIESKTDRAERTAGAVKADGLVGGWFCQRSIIPAWRKLQCREAEVAFLILLPSRWWIT